MKLPPVPPCLRDYYNNSNDKILFLNEPFQNIMQ